MRLYKLTNPEGRVTWCGKLSTTTELASSSGSTIQIVEAKNAEAVAALLNREADEEA